MMEKQMTNDFGIDLLVAQYALISVEYTSVEAAFEFIFGSGEESETLQHRFFGYVSQEYVSPATLDSEMGQLPQKCFICDR